MAAIDYLVLIGYLIGVVAVGALFTTRIKNTADMFAAGGQSPWWTSGLSGFMTMFSAGTFVVWGGIAFKHGLVAIAINLSYGIAALLAGYFVAGKWKRLGVKTPAQFIELRYGKTALHFYTWSLMIFRLVGVSVSLYSLAILMGAMIPLQEGNPLRDPLTGSISLTWAILIFGGIVVAYTMIGGLWAVLMTDVLQFIVLTLVVLFVAPLAMNEAGGFASFLKNAPDGFFSPTGGGYTWFFLVGWCAIHFFMIGAEWAFVQRFICVPTEKDARKSAYLFGGLYLISPFFWMLPPLLYRVQNPDANPEQAYILACKAVLPVGMVGLMLAAMFSATASTVSSQLNVFAGVLTNDIYQKALKSKPSDRHLVWAGRGFTILLGGILLGLALKVRHLGGAETVIITTASLLVGPLMAPTIWGLLSRRMDARAVFVTAGICFAAGLMMKFGFRTNGWFSGVETFGAISEWLQANSRTMDIVIGVALPALILSILHAASKRKSIGWRNVEAQLQQNEIATAAATQIFASHLPALIVAWSLTICGAMMAALVVFNRENQIITGLFALVLFLIAGTIFVATKRLKKK